jgi:hypothetical protein
VVKNGIEGPTQTLPPIDNDEKYKKVLEVLVYVLHTEAATCLGNHVLKFARYSCHTSDTWVANITLRTWRMVERERPKVQEKSNMVSPSPSGLNPLSHVSSGDPEPIKAHRVRSKTLQFLGMPGMHPREAGGRKRTTPLLTDDEPVYFPEELRDVWEGEGVNERLTFELTMSSVVLSTNPFGDFSKCTVITELLDDKDMEKLAADSRLVWLKFVHQPQTGRCLVFLLLLGRFCRKITQKYDDSIQKLASILKLDVSRTQIVTQVLE